MRFFTRARPASPLDVLAPVPVSDTPIFAGLAVESPLPKWDDVEEVAA